MTNTPSITHADARAYLATEEWPECDHNIDCVLNGDLSGLLSESDLADLDAVENAEKREYRMEQES